MGLYTYQQITRRLLNDQGFAQFNEFDLRDWVNTARQQIAAEGECIRITGTITVSPPTILYPFSTIVLSTVTGIQGPITVRTMNFTVATGALRVLPRPWPWYELYELCNPVPVGAAPRIYSQYGQGLNGSIYINVPDSFYTLNVDCACLPVVLTDNTSVEAIPYPWTDAVPYYATYMALMTAPGMDQAADRMFQLYNLFMGRARQGSTPTVLPAQYEQQADPTLANKLGSQPFRSAVDIGTGARGGRSQPTR